MVAAECGSAPDPPDPPGPFLSSCATLEPGSLDRPPLETADCPIRNVGNWEGCDGGLGRETTLCHPGVRWSWRPEHEAREGGQE